MKKYIYFLIIIIFVFGCKKEEKPFNSDGEYDGQPCPETPTITWGGQSYSTIQIGTQCWMGENLNVGIMINGQKDMMNNDTIEKYCFDDDTANCEVYGGLYQWNELMNYTTTDNKGICPTGWHIPTHNEMNVLHEYLGGSLESGRKLKEVGFDHWDEPNAGASNSSGFTALPGGERNIETGITVHGQFTSLGRHAIFWTSTSHPNSDAQAWDLFFESVVFSGTFPHQNYGLSVRCVKNH